MKFFTLMPAAAMVAAALPAFAQQAPDAGRLLQENDPPVLEAPRASPGVAVETPVSAPAAGGPQVMLQRVSVSGNTLFSEEALLAALGDVTGKSYDFAGLHALAQRLTRYYQKAGYPFARAYLPQQNLAQGHLQIGIVEGRYGEIKTRGDAAFTERAQDFLSGLAPGAMIESSPLERATLILNDQPGLRITPIIRPGQEVGAGDLIVDVQRRNRYSGEIGLDNFGNRATGRHRASFLVNADSPFTLGDQVVLQGIYTDEELWFGTLAYGAPIGSSGLRGRLSYTRSSYELAGDFKSLDASGTADVTKLGLSYPIVRSQLRNLTAATGIEYKRLKDKQDATQTQSKKSSNSLPIALHFDMRDQLGGAGITYGALTYTAGDLRLDATGRALDRTTARTEGNFHKLNLDIARIQSLVAGLELYGRLSAQWANKNLDSSEKFGLGGSHGVRAYPSGEGFGDEGALAQLELRYVSGAYSPYVFYDAGKIKVNRSPFAAGDNERSIAGGGIGLRYMQNAWRAGVSAAWRSQGGAPTSDTKDRQPMVWGSVQYRF